MKPLNPIRPITPESLLTNSLYHATSTIDDLTAALADFSRVPSPEPPSATTCCCGKEDCKNLKSWLTLKSRLGSRLILSAEVGQALLQRHEAYVRQHEKNNISRYSQHQDNATPDVQSTNEDLNLELETLTKEKNQLEKLLNQALVNSEVTEVSNKAILQELQDARATITRLTAHHARSVGWDTRLSAALKERDDMHQERDAETHRARLAESRFAVLKDKTAKLQTEVRRLQGSLEEKRLSRLESSETILQDARSRIQSFRDSQLGLTAKAEQDELTNVLESLVNDNEILKADNAELQHLLAESREDLHSLQETLEEQRVNIASPSHPGTPHSRHHHRLPSITQKDHTESKSRRRQLSQQFDSRFNPVVQAFAVPDTPRSSLFIPTDSLTPGQSSPSSHVSYEIDGYPENDVNPSEIERRRAHRPLLLLTRSRGIQTETHGTSLSLSSPSPLPSQLSSISSHDPRSESSSFSDSLSSSISTILDRVLALLNRMSQADALTLTNRLKRQHLKGADVSHLSRSTVSNILSEATGLRTQFRSLLEDDKVVLACTRKDTRQLFKFIKEVFAEMGQMRMTLNDVILDPSTASRVSELALNPGKIEAESKEREISAQGGAPGWMAPISKLFLPAGRTDTSPVDRVPMVPSASTRGTSRPPRFIPKLGPALAASATTVNVEFSGTGRSVTSTFSPPQPLPQTDPHPDTAPGVMGIFAGAPRSDAEFDPWIVVPPTQHVLRTSKSFRTPNDATIARSTGRKNGTGLSRNVDAVIDVNRSQDVNEESDFVPGLLERTLRRRGLSDSSIHSTFTSQADAPPSPHAPLSNHLPGIPSSRLPAWPDRSSVFQALSRTVQNIRATAAGTMMPLKGPLEIEIGAETFISPRQKANTPTVVPAKVAHADVPPSPSRPQTPTTRIVQPKPIRIASPNNEGGNVLQHHSAWTNSDVPVSDSDPFTVGSLRDESYVQRMISPSRVRDERGRTRDFF